MAGLLIFWLRLNVSGFRPVLARALHGGRPSMQLQACAKSGWARQ